MAATSVSVVFHLLQIAILWVVGRSLGLALPFTYWYEALRRFLLGSGSSAILGAWSDAMLLGALALSTLVFVLVSRWGYFALEREARRRGRLDQTTLF